MRRLLTNFDKRSGRYNSPSPSGHVIQSSVFFPSFRQWHTFDDKIKTAEYITPQAIQINGREIDLASEFIAMIEGRKQYNNLSSISITPHLKFKLDWSSDKLCWPNQLINNKMMITANDQIIGSISPGNRQYFFPLVGEDNSPAWDVILRDGSLVLRSQVKIVDQSELFIPASQRIPTVCKLAITDAAIVFPKDTVELHIAHVTEVAQHVMNEAQISYNLPIALLTMMQRLEGVYMRLSGGEKRQQTEAIETTAADESTEEESCKATDAMKSECVAKSEKPNDSSTKKDMHVVSLNLEKKQKFLTQFNSLQSSPTVARLYRMGLSHHITNAVEMTDRFLNDFSQLQAQRITLSYMLNPQIQFTNKFEESEDIFQQDQWLFLTTSREL